MLGAITNLQRAILQTAATRQDLLLAVPPNLKGGTAKLIARKFLGAGWVKEVRATKDAPVWRRNAAAGQAVGLKLTPAGKKAIEAAASGDRIKAFASTATRQDSPALPNADRAEGVDASASPPNEGVPSDVRAPRSGSKVGRVLAMLASESGATLDEIVAASGWLPHSARAVLTGLRKRGWRRNRDAAVEVTRASLGLHAHERRRSPRRRRVSDGAIGPTRGTARRAESGEFVSGDI